MLPTKQGAFYTQLSQLIEKRISSGADKAAVDKQIWDTFGEEWAVMFTDLSGFSRNSAEFGIIHFLQVIYESERIFFPIIASHNGQVIKTEADSLLVIFKNTDDAVQASIAMQTACKKHNMARLDEEKILLCVGLGYGRVLKIGDIDVFGAEVNAASKLGEDIAKHGEIFVTEAVYQSMKDSYSFVALKNLPQIGTSAAHSLVYSV